MSVPNGIITYSPDTHLESSATLDCKEGYSIRGSSVAACINVGLRADWNASFYCDVQGLIFIQVSLKNRGYVCISSSHAFWG